MSDVWDGSDTIKWQLTFVKDLPRAGCYYRGLTCMVLFNTPNTWGLYLKEMKGTPSKHRHPEGPQGPESGKKSHCFSYTAEQSFSNWQGCIYHVETIRSQTDLKPGMWLSGSSACCTGTWTWARSPVVVVVHVCNLGTVEMRQADLWGSLAKTVYFLSDDRPCPPNTKQNK